ncbi:CD48 antigen-like [Hoplias malabaricus]|uniref:CD48 antigen-like n=1 Tax=Hoplias malabaricus TaxID=27720 RepID=UPI0034630029
MSSVYRIPGAVIYLLFCCLQSTAGEEVVKLQELEGNTVIIHTGLTAVQSDAKILWFYGPEKADINIVDSRVFRGETVIDYYTERFRDRLQLNRNSGSLTIRNISRDDSGLYKLQIIAGKTSDWSFRVNVYSPVSKPVIRNQAVIHSASQGGSCCPLCTVENGKDVNLSWFEEKERISSINSTDSSDHLSLSLNITVSNNSTYTCVASNPVSNRTTRLNITQLCYINTVNDPLLQNRIITVSAVLAALGLTVVFLLMSVVWYKKKETNHQESEDGEMNYAEVKITSQYSEEFNEKKCARGTEIQDHSDSVVYSDIKT